jgi:hypothetical protein
VLVILGTGTRDVRDQAKAEELVWSLLVKEVTKVAANEILLVHGAAVGMDTLLDEAAKKLDIDREPWAANLFYSPLARNEFMVKMVAEFQRQGHGAVCWAFARKWKSGTGHCARRAREAGLTVIDYGVNTGVV